MTSSYGASYVLGFENGAVSSRRDLKGQEYLFVRNARNMIIESIDPQNRSVHYTVDGRDRVTSYTYWSGETVSFVYDDEGHLLSETDVAGRTTTYSYDPDGALIAITDPAGRTMTRTLDGNKNPIQVQNFDGTTDSYAYDSHGQIVSRTIDGVTESFTYSSLSGELASHTLPSGKTLSYVTDVLGRAITETSGDGEVTTYTYNPWGGLTGVSGAGAQAFGATTGSISCDCPDDPT